MSRKLWKLSHAICVQVETYQIAPDLPTHGYSGPLKVSHGRARNNVGEDYIATVLQYDKTRKVVEDANGMVMDVNRLQVHPGLPFIRVHLLPLRKAGIDIGS